MPGSRPEWLTGLAALAVVGACGTGTVTSSDLGATTSTERAVTLEQALPATTTPPGALTVGATVVRVVDGDTFTVRLDDGSDEDVRLLGVNANEGDECFGAEAGDYLRGLIDGRRVQLELSDERDSFGRLLALVHVDGSLVNRVLVSGGWVLARELTPHRFGDELEDAEAAARGAGLGLWASDACGAPSRAALRIDHVEGDAPGDDRENPNGEWVDIVNDGPAAVDLTGWTVRDESTRHRFTFDGVVLEPRSGVRLRSGCGADGPIELHWCAQGGAVWNNGGDTAFLLDPDGNVIDAVDY